MLPRATSRRLQGRQRQSASVREGGAVAVASRQQPADGVNIALEQVISRLFAAAIRARGETHLVTDRLQLGHNGAAAPSGRRQQRHAHGVQHGTGLRPHRHHVAHQHRRDDAPPHDRVLLDEAAGGLQRIGEQHGLHTRVSATGELSQQREQAIEPVGVAPQSVNEARIGSLMHIQHAGSSRNGRQPIADRMSQSAQQIVMNGEPALRASRLPGLATH